MGRKKIGLLAMAYGTPYKEDDIERYYTHIRHGRKPSPEALQDLTDRYQAIGGISPLARITEEQTKAIEERLNAMQETYEFVSYIGLRHIEPFIEDTVQKMAADGIEEAVSIVLAPHFSGFSIGTYNDRAVEAAEKTGKLHIRPVESWYKEEGFLEYWANEITNVYNDMPAEERNEAMLIVSAHSLPEKLLVDDPYVSQLEDTAKLISEKTGIATYEIGWQSEGNTPDPWIGPDVQDLTRELHEKHGYKAFVYAPVGFVADHLETLYDNDVECKVVCDQVGAAYYRPKMPNSDPLFIDTLAKVAYRTFTSDAK